MWVPGPGELAEEGPMGWPGRARVGVDIVLNDWAVLQGWCCGLILLATAISSWSQTFWIKSRSDAGLGRSPRERREEGQERMVETYRLPKAIHATN